MKKTGESECIVSPPYVESIESLRDEPEPTAATISALWKRKKWEKGCLP